MDHFKHRRMCCCQVKATGMIINSSVRKCKLVNIHITLQEGAERKATCPVQTVPLHIGS